MSPCENTSLIVGKVHHLAVRLEKFQLLAVEEREDIFVVHVVKHRTDPLTHRGSSLRQRAKVRQMLVDHLNANRSLSYR